MWLFRFWQSWAELCERRGISPFRTKSCAVLTEIVKEVSRDSILQHAAPREGQRPRCPWRATVGNAVAHSSRAPRSPGVASRPARRRVLHPGPEGVGEPATIPQIARLPSSWTFPCLPRLRGWMLNVHLFGSGSARLGDNQLSLVICHWSFVRFQGSKLSIIRAQTSSPPASGRGRARQPSS